jgi:hypothetical protein
MQPAAHMKTIEGSSTIEAVGYDPKAQTLTVKFKSGGSYDYAGVSKQAYDGMMSAKSVGSYLHSHIKPHFKPTKHVKA